MTKCRKIKEVFKMPKETFFNLKLDKREKIETALVNEFSRTTFEKASISNIIEEAQIPRGSFYQYFEDKEDAVKYIMQKYTKLEKEKMYNLLIETKGDIFEATLKMYDYIIEVSENEKYFKICKNIIQELRKNNVNVFEQIPSEKEQNELNKVIDTSNLKIDKKDDLDYIMKILTTISRTVMLEAVSNQITKEQGRIELERKLEILKKGMKK